jgi:hypothetical protein
MAEHFFTTTAGVKIPIQPISLLDLQLAQNAVEEQFREEGEPIDPPTYEVYLELEEKSEYHPHTEVTIKDATDEEKEAWQAYLDAVNKMQGEVESRTALVFLEGIIFDLPEDESWIKRRKRLFNEDVPEDEDERKLHYINNVLLKTPADKSDLMLEIQRLSMTGADEEAIEAFVTLFRRQMEAQGRPAIELLKAQLEEDTEDVVLQSPTKGRDSSKSAGNDNSPIPAIANSRSGRSDSSRENLIEDGGMGELPG